MGREIASQGTAERTDSVRERLKRERSGNESRG